MNGTIPTPSFPRSRPVVPPSSNPSGTLYIVATPIGNLEDITLRALRILEREVSVIAAEDTRRTRKLLNHYGIRTRTTSLHEHNESTKTATLLRRLAAGESVALVSDAGTPLLSDPGARLVSSALSDRIQVQPIPGPSALIAALVMSGFATGPFAFVGFPPSRSNARKKWASALATEHRAIVLFESPHRIKATLRDLADVFPNREAAVCREITKIHENLVRGPISELADQISETRGEFTVVIAADETTGSVSETPSARDLWLEFCDLTEKESVGRREAVRRIAEAHGLKPREVYSAIESEKMLLVKRPKEW